MGGISRLVARILADWIKARLLSMSVGLRRRLAPRITRMELSPFEKVEKVEKNCRSKLVYLTLKSRVSVSRVFV